MTEPNRPALFDNPETGPFWQAAACGQLVLPTCRACNSAHWYPRSLCPHCGSNDLDWRASAGSGAIYTFTVMRKAKPVRVPAYVTLDEGISLFTNILTSDPDALQIGQRVALRFMDGLDGTRLPAFVPLDGPRG